MEDVKKEISGFMQSESVAQEVAESDADMVQHYSISNIGWQNGHTFYLVLVGFRCSIEQ